MHKLNIQKWNIEEIENGIKICRGEHHRSDLCEWEYYSQEKSQNINKEIDNG